MCTYLIAHQLHPDLPIMVAGNRDEFYERPTAPPARLSERPTIVGGRDLRAGGTWLGLRADGLYVALTNRPPSQADPPEPLSRGFLVQHALNLGEPEAIHAWLRTLSTRSYRGFNLLFGDRRGLWVAYARAGQERAEIEAIPPGLHVLPNADLNAQDWPKVHRARALLAGPLRAQAQAHDLAGRREAGEEIWRGMAETLSDTHYDPALRSDDPHRIAPLEALCVITPQYGTRSATRFAVGAQGLARYAYADGRPGEAPWVDQMGLF